MNTQQQFIEVLSNLLCNERLYKCILVRAIYRTTVFRAGRLDYSSCLIDNNVAKQ